MDSWTEVPAACGAQLLFTPGTVAIWCLLAIYLFFRELDQSRSWKVLQVQYGCLKYSDKATQLIAWLCSKTLILAMIHKVQAAANLSPLAVIQAVHPMDGTLYGLLTPP